jgi:hypothetical protein
MRIKIKNGNRNKNRIMYECLISFSMRNRGVAGDF